MTPERLPGWLTRFADRHGSYEPTRIGPDRLHLEAADGATAELAVPFPPLAPAADPVAAVLDHVGRDRTVGVLLVRRGGFAVGVFAGTRLVSSKVGSGYVQSRTKAGGWSQQRFARRRANQASALWGDAADVAARILLPSAEDLAAVVTGGDQPGLQAVLGDPRLRGLQPLVAPRVLAVPDPKLAVLSATPDDFRAVSIELNDLA